MNNVFNLMTTILGDENIAYDVCRYLEGRQTKPTVAELTRIHGVGEATANKVLACMELSATYMVGTNATVFSDPDEIARRFCNLKYENQEHLYVLTLDSANHEVGCHEVTCGLVNQTPFHPREVLRYALMDNAVSVVLCHNHPSGSTDPSQQDMGITRVLAAACKIMQIAFLDHVIVSRSGYYSICRTNPDIFEATMNH